MNVAELGLVRRTIRDSRIVLVKELLVYRRLSLHLLPTLVTPAMVVFFQIGLLLFLAKSGDNGMVLAASIIGPFKQSMVTSFGLIVILGTTGPLAVGIISRERFGGALEGFLSTPISTTSLWIGKSVASWIPGAIVYMVSLVVTAAIINIFLGEIGAYSLAELRSSVGLVVLLLIVTLLFTAFLVELQLGSSQRMAVLMMFGQIGIVMIALPVLGYRLIRGTSLGNEHMMALEALSIPVFFLLFFLTKRFLLNREGIISRFSR